MNEIFDILLASQQANQVALDQSGRNPYPSLAVVTRVDDPENKRRIKVTDPAAPELESHWLRRVTPYPELDAPLPRVGDTVLAQWVDGDAVNGWYLSVQNATNPPANKQDPAKDFAENIPGNRTESTGGNHKEQVTLKQEVAVGTDKTETVGLTKTETIGTVYTITVGTTFVLANTAGASITLLPSGMVVISDAFGHKLTMGGGGDNNLMEWDLNGANLRIKNASDFQISTGSSGYKSISTVGAPDTAGETLTSRGW